MEYPNSNIKTNSQPESNIAGEGATFNYSNTPGQAKPPQNSGLGDSMLGSYVTSAATGREAIPAHDNDSADDGPKPPTIEHAADGAGDAPTSYSDHLSGFFDGRLMDANVLNQPEMVEQLQEARKQLDGVLKEYQVGDSAARQMFTTVDGYIRNPRTPDAMDQERETSLALLEKKWQGETEAMIKTAQRVLNELDKKVPGLADSIVSSGAANNADLIAHLANLGKKHGAKFTNSMGVSMLDSLWSKKV